MINIKKSFREIQNTFFFSYFFVEYSAVYEIKWKNTVQQDGPQIIII
jgi:hypothetical protein